jgi:hypothetical protein
MSEACISSGLAKKEPIHDAYHTLAQELSPVLLCILQSCGIAGEIKQEHPDNSGS